MNESFRERVLKVVEKIPKGRVLTYKEVATLAGSPQAYRAVGNILNENYNPSIPCHRVVAGGGKLGGFNRGLRLKRFLLGKEGYLS